MATDQEKTTEALRTAIQMEVDGKVYYLKASEESGNELGTKLLQSLAAEEDVHRKVFRRIYDAIRTKKGWPEVEFHHDEGRGLRTIFTEAAKKLGSSIKATDTEMQAVQGAIDMEVRSYDFYQRQFRSAANTAEKEFYSALSAQERHHQLVLLDYYEYLQDPADWFTRQEHHSLDGG